MPMRRFVQRWNFSAKNVYGTTGTDEREPRFARNLANGSGFAKEKKPAKVTRKRKSWKVSDDEAKLVYMEYR